MDDAAIHRASENAKEIEVCSLHHFHFSPFYLHSSSIYWITVDHRGLSAVAVAKGMTVRLLAQAHNESNGLVYLLHRFGINLSHKFSDSGNRDCLNLVHHQLGFFSKPVRLAWLEVESEQRCLD